MRVVSLRRRGVVCVNDCGVWSRERVERITVKIRLAKESERERIGTVLYIARYNGYSCVNQCESKLCV